MQKKYLETPPSSDTCMDHIFEGGPVQMDVNFGVISSDSHAQLPSDAFTSRMSKTKWGDRIPQIRVVPWAGKTVERWVVDGKVVGPRGVSNCPAAMGDPLKKTFPQRWEEVPKFVYDPQERLHALDRDQIDAEVLFFNDPIDSATLPFQFQNDREYELACVQAYNDALAEWASVSDRYIPIAIVPYLGDIKTTTEEVERAVGKGHRGIVMAAEPSMARAGLKHFNDRYWDPLWAVCQDLNIPIHWHAHANIKLLPENLADNLVLRRTAAFSAQPQFILNLVLSGIAERFPKLNWVCAETGMGWLGQIIELCDYVWARYHLWSEGLITRPSEVFQRQVYAHFWYEEIEQPKCDDIGIDHVLWISDFPHGTSSYPQSWKDINKAVGTLPQQDRKKLLYENALRLYRLPAVVLENEWEWQQIKSLQIGLSA